ncbi:hypothetical protein ABEB36_008763 [Hypothenemus hampei]|uniref:Uncharacterized protein n=1 Tax=Hypothenemus hampei TaxID=57062 RepID=A0ABD1ENM7_HYPHA
MKIYPQFILWTYIVLPTICLLISPTLIMSLARAQQQRAKVMANALTARSRAAAAMARGQSRTLQKRLSPIYGHYQNGFNQRNIRDVEPHLLRRKNHWDQQDESMGVLQNMWNMNNFGNPMVNNGMTRTARTNDLDLMSNDRILESPQISILKSHEPTTGRFFVGRNIYDSIVRAEDPFIVQSNEENLEFQNEESPDLPPPDYDDNIDSSFRTHHHYHKKNKHLKKKGYPSANYYQTNGYYRTNQEPSDMTLVGAALEPLQVQLEDNTQKIIATDKEQTVPETVHAEHPTQGTHTSSVDEPLVGQVLYLKKKQCEESDLIFDKKTGNGYDYDPEKYYQESLDKLSLLNKKLEKEAEKLTKPLLIHKKEEHIPKPLSYPAETPYVAPIQTPSLPQPEAIYIDTGDNSNNHAEYQGEYVGNALTSNKQIEEKSASPHHHEVSHSHTHSHSHSHTRGLQTSPVLIQPYTNLQGGYSQAQANVNILPHGFVPTSSSAIATSYNGLGNSHINNGGLYNGLGGIGHSYANTQSSQVNSGLGGYGHSGVTTQSFSNSGNGLINQGSVIPNINYNLPSNGVSGLNTFGQPIVQSSSQGGSYVPILKPNIVGAPLNDALISSTNENGFSMPHLKDMHIIDLLHDIGSEPDRFVRSKESENNAFKDLNLASGIVHSAFTLSSLANPNENLPEDHRIDSRINTKTDDEQVQDFRSKDVSELSKANVETFRGISSITDIVDKSLRLRRQIPQHDPMDFNQFMRENQEAQLTFHNEPQQQQPIFITHPGSQQAPQPEEAVQPATFMQHDFNAHHAVHPDILGFHVISKLDSSELITTTTTKRPNQKVARPSKISDNDDHEMVEMVDPKDPEFQYLFTASTQVAATTEEGIHESKDVSVDPDQEDKTNITESNKDKSIPEDSQTTISLENEQTTISQPNSEKTIEENLTLSPVDKTVGLRRNENKTADISRKLSKLKKLDPENIENETAQNGLNLKLETPLNLQDQRLNRQSIIKPDLRISNRMSELSSEEIENIQFTITDKPVNNGKTLVTENTEAPTNPILHDKIQNRAKEPIEHEQKVKNIYQLVPSLKGLNKILNNLDKEVERLNEEDRTILESILDDIFGIGSKTTTPTTEGIRNTSRNESDSFLNVFQMHNDAARGELLTRNSEPATQEILPFENILGAHKEKLDNIQREATGDDDLLMISFIGDSVVKDLEERRNKVGSDVGDKESRTKRSLTSLDPNMVSISKLIHDHNAKIDMPKTLDNVGIVVRQAFENPNAPMFHVRNMLGNTQNAIMSAVKIPPTNILVPTQYEITKLDNQNLGDINTKMLLSRSGVSVPQEDSFGIIDTFNKLGGMVKQSVDSGKNVVVHANDLASDAKNAVYSAKNTVPRLIMPGKVPIVGSRSAFGPNINPLVNKPFIITPRFLEMQGNILGARHEEPNQFVGMGDIMDYVGLSQPNQPVNELQQIILDEIPDGLTYPSNTLKEQWKNKIHSEQVGGAEEKTLESLAAAERSVGAKNLKDFFNKMHYEMRSILTSQQEERKKKRKEKIAKSKLRYSTSKKTYKAKKAKIMDDYNRNPDTIIASRSNYDKMENQVITLPPEIMNIFSENSPVSNSPQPQTAATTIPPTTELPTQDQTVGLFLAPQLLKPFMGQPSEQILDTYMETKDNELHSEKNTIDSLNVSEKPISPMSINTIVPPLVLPEEDFMHLTTGARSKLLHSKPASVNALQNFDPMLPLTKMGRKEDLGHILGAINPLMFEKYFNESLKIKSTSGRPIKEHDEILLGQPLKAATDSTLKNDEASTEETVLVTNANTESSSNSSKIDDSKGRTSMVIMEQYKKPFMGLNKNGIKKFLHKYNKQLPGEGKSENSATSNFPAVKEIIFSNENDYNSVK